MTCRTNVIGPTTLHPDYDVRTSRLANGTPFELPDDRWGFKLYCGAVVFGGFSEKPEERFRKSIAVSLYMLCNNDDLKYCRILPGTVEVEYHPPAPMKTLEEIKAITRERFGHANREKRDALDAKTLAGGNDYDS